MYDWRCPTGPHYFEEFQSLPDYDKKKVVKCTQHAKKCKRLLSTRQMIGGTSSFKMTESEEMQLGTSFNNSKDMDRFLKQNKLEPCHMDHAKPSETPMDKIHNSKSYKENQKNFIQAINAAAEGGVSKEVKQMLPQLKDKPDLS